MRAWEARGARVARVARGWTLRYRRPNLGYRRPNLRVS